MRGPTIAIAVAPHTCGYTPASTCREASARPFRLSDARRDTVTAEAILMIKSHSVRVPSVSVDHHAKCNARTEGGLLRQQTVSSIKLMTGLAPGTGGWMASVRACVCNGRVEDRSKVVRGTPRGTSLSKGTCHPPSVYPQEALTAKERGGILKALVAGILRSCRPEHQSFLRRSHERRNRITGLCGCTERSKSV